MDKWWSGPWPKMSLPELQTLLFCIWETDLQEPCNGAKYFDVDHFLQLDIGLQIIIGILVNRPMFRTWTSSLVFLLCISAKYEGTFCPKIHSNFLHKVHWTTTDHKTLCSVVSHQLSYLDKRFSQSPYKWSSVLISILFLFPSKWRVHCENNKNIFINKKYFLKRSI